MTFVSGSGKIVNIGAYQGALDVTLRESGRFILKDVNAGDFIALSEKKTKTITIAGAIAAAQGAEYLFYEYNANPDMVNGTFESGDLFPQDMLNEFPIQEENIYGMLLLVDLALSAEPADAIARLIGGWCNFWIARQPVTTPVYEDAIEVGFSAYCTTPLNGIGAQTDNKEGVYKLTTKKKIVPMFVPIKSSTSVRKTSEKIYLYSEGTIIGRIANSAAGGNVAGSAILDQRLIVGQGYLPEEVEELLCSTQ